MRKHLSTALKIAVTLAALFIVVRQIDLQAVWQTLRRASLGWVLVGFILFNLSMVVRSFRWWLLLRGLGVEIRLGRLLNLYFVGNFFNMALPSGFGGDVVRAMEISRQIPANMAAGTVILDRLSGLVMLFVMAIGVLPWQTAVLPPAIIAVIIIGAVLGVGGGLLLVDGRLIRRWGNWLPKPLNPNQDGAVGKLLQAIQGCGWRAIVGALLVSVLFNLMLAGWWVTSARALGATVAYPFQVLIMPLVALPLLIPSVGGLGPRELIVPTLYASVGLASETAVAISLLVFVIMRLSGLVGAPLYLISQVRHYLSQRHLSNPTP